MHVISEMRLTVVGAALVIGLAAAVGDASAPAAEPSAPRLLPFLKQRQAVRYQRVPREVLAFYYTWYGRPERQGRWVHWGSVDPDAHDISQSTHYPALGAYDSHDRQVIDRHIAQAKQHGLTGFIATWWGRGTYDDRAFATLLERAAAQDFKVTVYWETAPGKDAAQVAQAIDDLSYVLQRYAESEAFLKVDGKPVLFVYGRVMDQMPLGAWPAIFEGVRQRYGRDFALIADGYSEAYARLFDGVHTYNICGWVRDQSPDALRRASAASFSSAVQLARSQGKISCLTIIPGYDDTKIRKPGLKAERQNGETYRVLWDEATRADPDWILITSWNEWHEGSEIEPSWEDGEKYLQLTKPFAERFRATPHSLASSSAQPAGPSPAQARALSELYRGRPIGVLPEYGHAVVFWLAEAGVPLQELTWQDVLDPRALDPARLPMLLYAGGEHYVRTVRRDGDAEAALRAYLAGGGLLMAFSHQPYPFFLQREWPSGHRGRSTGTSDPRQRAAARQGNARSKPCSGVGNATGRSRLDLPDRQPAIGRAAGNGRVSRRWRPALAAGDARFDRADRRVPSVGSVDRRRRQRVWRRDRVRRASRIGAERRTQPVRVDADAGRPGHKRDAVRDLPLFGVQPLSFAAPRVSIFAHGAMMLSARRSPTFPCQPGASPRGRRARSNVALSVSGGTAAPQRCRPLAGRGLVSRWCWVRMGAFEAPPRTNRSPLYAARE